MKLVIQRVSRAQVSIKGKGIAQIGRGLLVYAGVEKGDTEEQAEKFAKKLPVFRIFEDEDGKMNRSVQEICGEVLVVSQFTLAADIRKGARPGFDTAEAPDRARQLIEKFVQFLVEEGVCVKEGVFGAHMEVLSVNDGPVTFLY
ncbi:MAG TPA: D-aminoacyl-tRNA deacylase [Candidatus Omnitrophota bacterium]|nr:D-aminoacyl-tRNA deacylase [Candidatus Omnitrophota bacterium]